jgi:K+-transporting ATPase KdpF subunit
MIHSIILKHEESPDGYCLSRWNISIFHTGFQPRGRLQKTGRRTMTWLHILGGLVSVGLLIYLVAALLKAEDL